MVSFPHAGINDSPGLFIDLAAVFAGTYGREVSRL